jgi:hypothetical protein
MMLTRSKIRAAAILVVALGTGWYVAREQGAMQPARQQGGATRAAVSPDPAQAAFEARARGRMIAANGVVERILADDRDGSPHQRFIVRTPGGLSLLVAHNLDLAARLDGLAPGDEVTVRGEYEWSDKGGVMHWTHDDPQGRHEAGYIEWRGRRYQ